LKKICVVTGARAEYGILKPVMEEIARQSELELVLIVAGMHLAADFGRSVEEIESDGFEIAGSVEMCPVDDSPAEMAHSLGRGVTGYADLLSRVRPDVLLVLGDRTEALAATLAAAYQNCVVAHVHGGDTSMAGLDESARHAITKFAHVHFPATETSAGRIRGLGEEEWRIHVVGAPGLDSILASPPRPRARLEQELGLSLEGEWVLLLQHPVTTEPERAGEQITETLKAVRDLGLPVVAVYPNSDSGARAMIARLEQHRQEHPRFALFRNLSHPVFLGLLGEASVLVGNSSSGIIEAASFQLPVVDIGIRQRGRERVGNVLQVEHDHAQILAALERALSPDFRRTAAECTNPYGDGQASPRIAKALANLTLEPRLLQKQITY
jgi:UDP-N-acetylglucosamine 2-epimerase (non-hydrolysing)/GDP/UDP-N,N'-diacetylbacillosamine 2-epimerase (hydrolysing)